MNLVPLSASPVLTTPLTDAIIDLIYAGHDLAISNANYAMAVGTPEAIGQADLAHQRYCAAVEAVKKAVL